VVLLQVFTSILLLVNKYTIIAAIINIAILLAGIITFHFKEGWFIVGGGRNGMEFSFVLIIVLLAIIFPNGLTNKKTA
jgi:putative oxidoreductase